MATRQGFALTIVGAVLLGASLVGAQNAQPDAYRLTIGDDVYNVPVGKPFAVMIGGQRVTMRIDGRTASELSVDGVRFQYPMSLAAEPPADEGGVTIWALQGSSVALMLQRYDGELDPKSLLKVLTDNIAEQYQDADLEREPVQLRGAERVYPGEQLRVTTVAANAEGGEGARVDLVQNVFAFASGPRVFALVVQDTRPAGDGDTEEYGKTLRLLGDTLKTAPPARRSATPASRTPPRQPTTPQRRSRRLR